MAGNGQQSHSKAAPATGSGRGPVRGYGMGPAAGGGAPAAGRQAAAPQPGSAPYGAAPAGAATVAQGYGAPARAAAQPPAPGPYGPAAYGAQPYGAAAYQAPATSVPKAPPRRRRTGLAVALGVAVLCAVLACLLALAYCNGKPGRAGEAGQLEGKTEAEIQAELDRQVEEGMFNISIASNIQFADGTAEGELRIENVPGNPYLMAVTITRDDTGQQIYESGLIEPDHHIQRDTLDVDLDAGTYPCTATFAACDQATEQVVGQAAAKVTVQVLG